LKASIERGRIDEREQWCNGFSNGYGVAADGVGTRPRRYRPKKQPIARRGKRERHGRGAVRANGEDQMTTGKFKPLTRVLTVAGAIVTITAAATAIGYQIDRPAWKSELDAQAQTLDEVAGRSDRNSLRSVRNQLNDAIWQLRAYEQKRVRPPKFLLDRINQLKDRERRILARIKRRG